MQQQDSIDGMMKLLKKMQKLSNKDNASPETIVKKKKEELEFEVWKANNKPRTFSVLETTGIIMLLAAPVGFTYLYIMQRALHYITETLTQLNGVHP